MPTVDAPTAFRFINCNHWIFCLFSHLFLGLRMALKMFSVTNYKHKMFSVENIFAPLWREPLVDLFVIYNFTIA